MSLVSSSPNPYQRVSDFKAVFESYCAKDEKPKSLQPVTEALHALRASISPRTPNALLFEKMCEKWIRLCRGTCKDLDIAPEKMKEIATKITKISDALYDALGKEIVTPANTSCHFAQHLSCFEDPLIYTKVVRLPLAAEQVSQRYSNAISHTKRFLCRMLKGEFGAKALEKLVDPTKSFMLSREGCLRVLLVEQLLGDNDTCKTVEWFQALSSETFSDLQTQAKEIKKKLQDTYGLSDSACFYLLAFSTTQLPKEFLIKLNDTIANANIDHRDYTHIQECFRPFYSPSDKMLGALVHYLLGKNRPDEAKRVAKEILDEQEKKGALSEIIKWGCTTEKEAFAFIQTFAGGDTKVKAALVKEVVQHSYEKRPLLETLQGLFSLLHQYTLDDPVIVKEVIEDFIVDKKFWSIHQNQKRKQILLEMKRLPAQEIPLFFEQCLRKYLVQRKDNPESALSLCREWISDAKNVFGDDSLAAKRAEELIVVLTFAWTTSLDPAYQRLSNDRRISVLNTTAQVVCKTSECRKSLEKIKEIASKLPSENERSHVYTQTSLLLAQKDCCFLQNEVFQYIEDLQMRQDAERTVSLLAETGKIESIGPEIFEMFFQAGGHSMFLQTA